MTGIDRRGFVKLGAAGACLLGAPKAWAELQAKNLRAAAAAPAVPAAPIDWARFRGELKKRNQPGVIVLLQSLNQPVGVPAQKQKEQEKAQAAIKRLRVAQPVHPGNHLATAVHNTLFSTCDSDLPQLLVQAVFIAASADQARKAFPSIPSNAGLALIDVDGKVAATLPIDAQLGMKFTERAVELVYGKDGGRLAERVKAERTALGESVCQKLDAAIIDLDADEFSRREIASETLGALLPRIPAALALAHRRAESLEVRTRIDTMFRRKLHDDNSSALLKQSLAPHVVAGLNFNIREKCGQGSFRPNAHEFAQRWCAAADQQA